MERLMKLRYSLLPFLAVVLLLGATSCNHAMYEESNGGLRSSIFKYGIAKQDSQYYMVVNSKSEFSNREFTDSTRMRFTLPDDSEYSFDGLCVHKGNLYDVIIAVIIPIPLRSRVSTAVFPIKESTLNLFENGISGVGITMTERNHERKFKNDKFGKALYKQYKKLKDK